MAGNEILKKQTTGNISETANLNASFNVLQANVRCCLRSQQLQLAEPNNNNKCNINSSPMEENSTINNYCDSSCTFDGRNATNCNCNINKPAKKRPFTLSIAVIIMSLTISLIYLPAVAHSKSVYAELAKSTIKEKHSAAETSAELDAKLLLSLYTEAQPSEQNSFFRDELSSDSSDTLTSLDVLKHHLQRNQRHQRHKRERRMRLHKRQIGDLLISKYMPETANNLEWSNPCNVHSVNMEVKSHHATDHQIYQYLIKFKRDVGVEYEILNDTAKTINITDIADWSKHDEVYKFLPKLNASDTIALNRWYRSMQVYVGSFGRLARSQYTFDEKKRMYAGSISKELNKFLISARYVLCELETIINGSVTKSNLRQLKINSRRSMNRHLNFVTKNQLPNSGIKEANIVDLKFAKFCYYEFLLNMQKIIQHNLKNKSRRYGIVEGWQNVKSIVYDTIVVGNDTSRLDFSSIFKSDSTHTIDESLEIHFKTTNKPDTNMDNEINYTSTESTESTEAQERASTIPASMTMKIVPKKI